MGPAIGAAIAAGAELLGGAVSAFSASRETQKQRDWQTYMSNTAYQRASKDMVAAGLNPMMMYGGGHAASTPSGGIAGVPGEALAQGISRASGSAKSWMRAKDEMRLLREEVANAQKTGRMIQAQERKAQSEGDLVDENLRRLTWDSRTVMEPRARAEIANLEANSANALASARFAGEKTKWLMPSAISGIVGDVLRGLVPFGRMIPGRKVLRPRGR